MNFIAYALKEYRKKHNLSLEKLAKKIGYSAMYLCDIENEKRVPQKKETLTNIADLLGINKIHIFNIALDYYIEKKRRELGL